MIPIPGSVIGVNFPHGTIGADGSWLSSASRYAAGPGIDWGQTKSYLSK
jgi:hypothetical protein